MRERFPPAMSRNERPQILNFVVKQVVGSLPTTALEYVL